MVYEPLDAGALDKRVTIQSRSESDDGGGGLTIAWQRTVTVWASVEPGSGTEFFKARELEPELSHIVTIRHRDGITPKHRILYVSRGITRAFAIHSVADPLERHEQLILMCSEQPIT